MTTIERIQAEAKQELANESTMESTKDSTVTGQHTILDGTSSAPSVVEPTVIVDNAAAIDEETLVRIQEEIEYQMMVDREIDRLTEPPFIIKNVPDAEGNLQPVKVYTPNFFNAERIALHLYCKAIDYDRELCDLLIKDELTEFRKQVADLGIPMISLHLYS